MERFWFDFLRRRGLFKSTIAKERGDSFLNEFAHTDLISLTV